MCTIPINAILIHAVSIHVDSIHVVPIRASVVALAHARCIQPSTQATSIHPSMITRRNHVQKAKQAQGKQSAASGNGRENERGWVKLTLIMTYSRKNR
jgi:hypothetical protein